MKIRAYTIKDNMLKMAYVPFFAEDDKAAKKVLLPSVADEKNLLCIAAAKYELYCIGEFDSDTGIIEELEPEKVCTLLELKGMVNYG